MTGFGPKELRKPRVRTNYQVRGLIGVSLRDVTGKRGKDGWKIYHQDNKPERTGKAKEGNRENILDEAVVEMWTLKIYKISTR